MAGGPAGAVAILERAARGEIEAQVVMLDQMIMTALRTTGDKIVDGVDAANTLSAWLFKIELWANLVATHGRPEDVCRLACVMLFRGSMCRFGGRESEARAYIDQGLQRLDALAEQGHGPAADKLAWLSDRLGAGRPIPAEIMLSGALTTG